MKTQPLIYGVSMSWAGHVLLERPATEIEKGLRLKETSGGSYIPAVRSHPHCYLY